MDDDGEILVDGLAVGSPFHFLISLVLVIILQFIGFMIILLTSTTHAGRNGAKVGMGFTLIQFSLYMSTQMNRYRHSDDWVAYGLMAVGCFIILKSCLEHLKVIKMKAMMLTSTNAVPV